MNIEILTAESLGVRGLCCYVKTKTRKILIDPGIALGYSRHGLLPHPFQVAVDERIKEKIVERWRQATDIVISHFHGDHVPLAHPNPYQLSIHQLPRLRKNVKVWISPFEQLNELEKKRFFSLQPFLGRNFIFTENQFLENLSFSRMVFHGESENNRNRVFMTRIEDDNVFVHGSDIQLLDHEAIQILLSWKPDILLVSGPPLYLSLKMNQKLVKTATANALLLSKNISTVIIDHHLLRNDQGITWLREINRRTKNRVICAADFMNKPLKMLEANRLTLYEDMPVMSNWHEEYANGLVNPQGYWDRAKNLYFSKKTKNEDC